MEKILPETIYTYAEQALQDYHSIFCLNKNSLITLLNLQDRQQENNKPCTAGLTLHSLLDRTIDMIAGALPTDQLPLEQWRLNRYLHLRYRQNISLSDLASCLGYTEHHLLQLHQEFVLEAAEVLLKLVEEMMGQRRTARNQ